jgi:hypothetical protein
MNCDDVFEALTDPAQYNSGQSSSAQLAEHLETCPRCRQMQQVLEPARSLLCGDLPAERVPAVDSHTGTRDDMRPAAASAPLLSVEAVGLAESIAAKLTAASGGKSVRAGHWFANRRILAATLRSAALVVFGALAVYCIGPREREADSMPAVVPPVVPTNSCTRMSLQRKGTASQDARGVILSCVACHLKQREPGKKPASTTLFWPRRSTAARLSLAVAEGRGPRANSGTLERAERLFS